MGGSSGSPSASQEDDRLTATLTEVPLGTACSFLGLEGALETGVPPVSPHQSDSGGGGRREGRKEGIKEGSKEDMKEGGREGREKEDECQPEIVKEISTQN